MNKIRLVEGDCFKILDTLTEEGVKVDAVITDIPYGITANKWDTPIPLDNMWKSLYKVIKKDTNIVLFGTEPFASTVRLSNRKDFLYDWIWEKPNGANFLQVKYRPFKVHECIMVFSKIRKPKYNPQFTQGKPYKQRSGERPSTNFAKFKASYSTENTSGKRYPRSVQKFDNCKRGNQVTKKTFMHPTEKPLDLMEYLVKTYSNENDVVLDFTMGCGNTGLACMNTDRQFIGIELDKFYFNTAVERLTEKICSEKYKLEIS
jgi:site-specific DNA-methyltransferase (adenine-specific)